MTTLDDLFEKHRLAVQELSDNEQAEVTPLEQAFAEFCKPHEAVFDEATKTQQEWVKDQIKPVKKKMDEKVARWKREFNKKVDAEVARFAVFQNELRVDFERDTAVERNALTAAIIEEKTKLEADVAEIDAKYTAKLEELEAAYQEAAKALEAELEAETATKY